jgi:hypothetical protein
MSMEHLGHLLVSVSVDQNADAAQMTNELREIHDEFIRNHDAETGYFRMGFVAAKAIERCRQLEGSDGSRTRGGSDRRRTDSADDRGHPFAQSPDGATPGAPGGSSQRST